MPIFVKKPIKNQGIPHKLEYNFLLKRKLAIGVYVTGKSVFSEKSYFPGKKD
jgi:hypothetical protein